MVSNYIHTAPKSGIPESTELDMYGLLLRKLKVSSNLPYYPDTDYEKVLNEAKASPCGVMMENVKDLTSMINELYRDANKIEVVVMNCAYNYKFFISCLR